MGRREDIRDAALAIIDEGGIHALTLPRLFDRVHTGAGTFYHYFTDREELIEDIFSYCYEVAKTDLFLPDDPSASPRERFDALCRNMYHAYHFHPRELNFLYWFTFEYVEPSCNCCHVIPSIMILTDIINYAQVENLISSKSKPAILARIVRSMMASVFWGYQHGIAAMSDKSVCQFADGAWHALEYF